MIICVLGSAYLSDPGALGIEKDCPELLLLLRPRGCLILTHQHKALRPEWQIVSWLLLWLGMGRLRHPLQEYLEALEEQSRRPHQPARPHPDPSHHQAHPRR